MISGLAMHCHHDVLFEFCYSLEERQRYIRAAKPVEEQALRLRLLQIIPPDRLPAPVVEHFIERDKLSAEYDKFFAMQVKLSAEYDKFFVGYVKLSAEVDKLIEQCLPELRKLHAELCPDCPFNGQTIFTRKNESGAWY